MASAAQTARTSITIQADINVHVDVVWKALTDPQEIVQWNAASDDWHTTKATNDLTVGGRFSSHMAAKDGSRGFDFEGTYTLVEPNARLEYKLDDERTVATVLTELVDQGEKKTRIVQTFEAEGTHSVEQQQSGWQAILNNLKKHVEATSLEPYY